MTKKEEYQMTKDYLYSVVNLDKEINENIRRIGELKQKARGTAIRYDTDRVQTSGSKDRIGDIVAEYTTLEEETDRLIDEYVDLKEKMINQISLVDKDSHKTLLELKYIEGKSIYDIAVIMDKPDGTCKRWHTEAVTTFFEKNRHNILYSA